MVDAPQFSSNWFQKLAQNNFDDIIKPQFKDVKINYLEIGCFEGNSLTYMFKNVLTHPDSHATVIDPFDDFNNCKQQYNRFMNNMKPHLNQITAIQGYSQNELPKLPANNFDFIYIDGDHTSNAAFVDAVLSFPLLKVGGYIIFDDYMWLHDGDHSIPDANDPRLNHPNNPHSGVNNFLNLQKSHIEIVRSNWQMIIKKIN